MINLELTEKEYILLHIEHSKAIAELEGDLHIAMALVMSARSVAKSFTDEEIRSFCDKLDNAMDSITYTDEQYHALGISRPMTIEEAKGNPFAFVGVKNETRTDKTLQ